MIKCDITKTIIILNPRAASTSLVEIFGQIPSIISVHVHEFASTFYLYNKKGYKCYAFCRDPLDRLVSSLIYLKRSENHLDGFLRYFFKIHVAPGTNYKNLPEDIQQKIETVSLDDMVNSNYKKSHFSLYSQLSWIEPSFVIKKNFHNFEPEVKSILDRFDGSVLPINHSNKSLRLDNDIVTDTLREKAVDLYYKDYEFLDKLGFKYK